MKSADCSDSSGALAPERITLAAGESITVPIEAANPNRATGIHFEAGGVYRLDAAGKWYDAGRETDPAGYKEATFCRTLSGGCAVLPKPTGSPCSVPQNPGKRRSLSGYTVSTRLVHGAS